MGGPASCDASRSRRAARSCLEQPAVVGDAAAGLGEPVGRHDAGAAAARLLREAASMAAPPTGTCRSARGRRRPRAGDGASSAPARRARPRARRPGRRHRGRTRGGPHRRAGQHGRISTSRPPTCAGREAAQPRLGRVEPSAARRGTDRRERRLERRAIGRRESSTSFGTPAVPEVASTRPVRSGSGGAGSATPSRRRRDDRRRPRTVDDRRGSRSVEPGVERQDRRARGPQLREHGSHAGPGGRSTATR